MTRIRLFFLCLLLGAYTLNAQQIENYLNRPLPDGWQEKDTLFQQVLPVDDRWWKVFEDPTLDSLINLAMDQNPSVLMAINRIDQAKAQWRISQSDFYPSLSFHGGWERQQTSGNLGNGTPQAWTGYYSASVQMSWQLDVFGVIRQKAKAQKELYAASKEEYNATMVSLCAEVASAYFNLREMQQEVDVLRRNAVSQEAVVAITETRYKTGLVSKLDVAQAKSVYYNTLATIPRLDAYITQCVNQLAILLGTYPSTLKDSFDDASELPSIRHIVNVGIPADVIRNRPDVRQAEYLIESQAALIGAAKADYYPKFSINGSFGFLSHDIDKFLDNESRMFSFTPTLTWNLFSGLQTRKNVKIAEIALTESIDNYNNVILNAIQEVETEMSNYANALKTIEMGQQVVEQGNKTLELSIDLYKRGLGTFTNVLDAQRTVLSDQNYLVSAWNSALLSLVRLYTALGGNWE